MQGNIDRRHEFYDKIRKLFLDNPDVAVSVGYYSLRLDTINGLSFVLWTDKYYFKITKEYSTLFVSNTRIDESSLCFESLIMWYIDKYVK